MLDFDKIKAEAVSKIRQELESGNLDGKTLVVAPDIYLSSIILEHNNPNVFSVRDDSTMQVGTYLIVDGLSLKRTSKQR